MTTLRRMYDLLAPNARRDAWRVLALMVVGMIVDTLGIGLVIPGIALLLQPGSAALPPWALDIVPAALFTTDRTPLIAWAMVVLIVAYLARTTFLAYLAWRQSGFAYGVQADLSQRLMARYLGQSYVFHLQRNSAELIRNATREVEYFTLYCVINVLLILTEGLVAIGVAILLLIVEPVGALSAAGVLLAAALGFSVLSRRWLKRWGTQRQLHDGLRLQRLQEGLGGAKEVMLLGRAREFLARFRVHNEASARLAQRQATVLQLPRLWLELLAVVALAALVLSMLARGRDVGTLLPTLGLFAIAGFRLMPSVNRVVTAVQGFRFGQPTIDVLHAELATDVPPAQASPNSDTAFSRELRLRDVTFTYPGAGAPSLSDVSLEIRAGESVGIVGASGAGKSTLVDLCLGLLQPTTGAITVDGDAVSTRPRAWQDQIGYVPQSVFLTDDTLRRNIAFGLPDDRIDDSAVARAVRDAQLAEFVASLPNGLDTLVGERGTSLSGGQRQRVGIARALYHDPAVLVLDEATSALDTETERGVLRAVQALRGRKTIVMVAHRLSTVEICDRIIRLDRGLVVGEGQPALMLRERAGGIG